MPKASSASLPKALRKSAEGTPTVNAARSAAFASRLLASRMKSSAPVSCPPHRMASGDCAFTRARSGEKLELCSLYCRSTTISKSSFAASARVPWATATSKASSATISATVLGRGIELRHHLDGRAEIIIGRRRGAKDVFVAALEDLARRAPALNHRHLVFLGHGRIVERVVAAVGAEQEIDLFTG